MITENTPSNWKELQDWCAQLLRECGFQVKTEVSVDLVRGQAEIDVFATERIEERTYTSLIECKNWQSKVPQHVVHSFRTVVGDLGANTGYIVSKAGFQSGAYEAAEKSNIKLLDWSEFQGEFERQWLSKYLRPEVDKRFMRLDEYLEAAICVEDWYKSLTATEEAQWKELQAKYSPITFLLMLFSPYFKMANPAAEVPTLPLSASLPTELATSLPESLTNRTGYRQLLEELEDVCRPIEAEFGRLERTARARC